MKFNLLLILSLIGFGFNTRSLASPTVYVFPKADLTQFSQKSLMADKKVSAKNCTEARDQLLKTFDLNKDSSLLKMFKEISEVREGLSVPISYAVRSNDKTKNYKDSFVKSNIDLVVQSYPSDKKPITWDGLEASKQTGFDPFHRLDASNSNSWTLFINYLSPNVNFYQSARRPKSHQAVELIFETGAKGCQLKLMRIHDFRPHDASRAEIYQIVELSAVSCLNLKLDDSEVNIPMEMRDIAETHIDFCGQLISQHDWTANAVKPAAVNSDERAK